MEKQPFEDGSPIENGDIRASHVSFQVFFSACLRRSLFEAMPDGTDSPIWRALSAQVRRGIFMKGTRFYSMTFVIHCETYGFGHLKTMGH